MDPELSPEAEEEEEVEEENLETDQLNKEKKEDCFYLNWELIEWMTEPCHPCMTPRSDSG